MEKPKINYDEMSDTLYVSFEPGTKATGIELNEHILLRINKDRRKAIGLTLFEYSLLAHVASPWRVYPSYLVISGSLFLISY